MEEKEAIWTGKFIMVLLMSAFSGIAANMTYPLITKYALTITLIWLWPVQLPD